MIYWICRMIWEKYGKKYWRESFLFLYGKQKCGHAPFILITHQMWHFSESSNSKLRYQTNWIINITNWIWRVKASHQLNLICQILQILIINVNFFQMPSNKLPSSRCHLTFPNSSHYLIFSSFPASAVSKLQEVNHH